jgi:hypothetical protein
MTTGWQKAALGGVTMGLHKLTAGSGYDYLTRQVAALDATEKGHVGLAAYYTERGESPGAWVGSGMAGIDGLNAGDPVTAEQMRNLFGCGLHPLAEQRDFENVMQLGLPFRTWGSASPFQVEVAKRITDLNSAPTTEASACPPPTGSRTATAGPSPTLGGTAT